MSQTLEPKPDRSNRVYELFVAARDRSTGEQRAWLERQDAPPDVLDEVRALLDQADPTRAPSTSNAADRSATSGPTILPPGASVGLYTIRRELGEGGFGVVYLAEQTTPVRRQVALKVIKAGMDTRAIVARFEQERQTLALMDHPSIAKVLDAGATPDGRPYFAMEYVDGPRITDYAATHRLTIAQRLELFIAVCEAVQHAHTKGVIHRDLKPSNVLVKQPASGSGGVARPVVIDFGVAKALAGSPAGPSLHTQPGQLIGTPEYMSPEQASLDPSAVDTRSDVYSLGVMLYELLTGVLPFDSRDLREGTYEDLCRMIREVEPPKPSTRLTTLADPETRGIPLTAPALGRQLRRELEWIPLKAMRKNPDHRYRSPVDLADDLRRYLAGEALVAGPESKWYRVRKFAKKHRGAVTTTTIVFAIVSTLLVWVNQERMAAEKHRQRVEQLEADNRFFRSSMDEFEDVFVDEFVRMVMERDAEGNPITVKSALESAFVKAKLKERSGFVRATLSIALSKVYSAEGDHENANKLAEEALDVGARSGPKSWKHAEAIAVRASAHYTAQNFKAAIARGREALSAIEPFIQSDRPELRHVQLWAETAHNLAVSMFMYEVPGVGSPETERALPFLEESLARADRLGLDALTSAKLRVTLGQLYLESNRKSEGMAILDRSVQTIEMASKFDPVFVSALRSLAKATFDAGDHAKAIAQYGQLLAVQRKVLSPNAPDLANTLHDYGHMLRKTDMPAAVAAMQESIDIFAKLPEKQRVQGGPVALNLALWHRWAKEYDKAEAIARHADEVLMAEQPFSSEYRDTSRSLWAAILVDQERYAEAVELLRPVVDASTGKTTAGRFLARAYDGLEKQKPGQGYREKAEEARKMAKE